MPRGTGAERAARTLAFARAARAYWFGVYSHVARELRFWGERAAAIEDPVLRSHALAALAKRGNMEGAAAFATFVPRGVRARVVRATVAFQAAYNHLDVISEQPCADPLRNSMALHDALLVALDPGVSQLDYYAHHHRRGDGGYLAALVETCRRTLAGLPSYEAVSVSALRAAVRVREFQYHQAGGDIARHAWTIRPWGEALTPEGCDLRWWEAAAAAGSSLGVHAAIALAAEPGVTRERARALQDTYFPWIGALHSLLDHLIDADEDARDGQRNLIDCYASREEAAQRMALLAERALSAARAYSAADAASAPGRARTYRHELVVAAMACFYLSDPGAQTPEAAPIADAVLARFGPLAKGPLAVFKARGWVESRLPYSGSSCSASQWLGRIAGKWRRSSVTTYGVCRRSARATTDASVAPSGKLA